MVTSHNRDDAGRRIHLPDHIVVCVCEIDVPGRIDRYAKWTIEFGSCGLPTVSTATRDPMLGAFSETKMRSRSYECHTVTLCFQFRKNSTSAFSASIAALHVYAPRRSCRPRCPVIIEAFPRGDERT